MKGYWDQLRPLEKRMVVGIGAVLFVVLNFWFVVPHFGDWTKVKIRMAEAQRKQAMYQKEIDQIPRYEREIKTLEGEGLDVPAEDQIPHFQSAIQTEAVRSGVNQSTGGRITTQTNQFFVEQSQIISVQAKEEALVDFLYKLGSGNSLIRVRDLSLRPDPQHHELSASPLKLVASYQKRAPVRGAPGVQKSSTPAAKTPSPAPATQKSARPTTPTPTNSPARPPQLPGGKSSPSTSKKT